MDATSPPFERLLRGAASPAAAAPLLRALGFESRLEPMPLEALGLGGEAGVRTILGGGECGGLSLLIVEVSARVTPADAARVARLLAARNPAVPRLFVLAWPRWSRLAFVSLGLDREARQLVLERRRPKASDVEALEELAARPGEGGTALALRHARALDRTRITRHFFRDFKAQRLGWRQPGGACRRLCGRSGSSSRCC